MPSLPFSLELSSFVKDFDKSFWKGRGTIAFTIEQMAAALERDPGITIGAFREQLRAAGDPLLASTGIDFSFKAEDKITFGAADGERAVGFNINVAADAFLYVILAPDALASLENERPADLDELLRTHTVLDGRNALVVLSCSGEAGAAFTSSVLNKPGMDVGVSFKAGAEVGWFVCRPVRAEDTLADAIRDTFSRARLPQTALDEVDAAGRPLLLQPNEILYSAFSGFLTIGAEAKLGYDMSGSRSYAVGKMDLASRLLVQARAKVNVSYGLAGAFRVLVLPSRDAGWVRVVVQKDRTSQFDFGLAVNVDAQLKTTGLPAKDTAGFALLEAIVGGRPVQIARQVIEVASLTPQQLRKKADGFVTAFVEKWCGQAFDALDDTGLTKIIEEIADVAHEITHIDDRLLGLYERFGKKTVVKAANWIDAALAAGDIEKQRQALVAQVSNDELREILELLLERAFGEIFVRYDELRTQLAGKAAALRALLLDDAGGLIEKFVDARVKALGLEKLFATLKTIDTPEKLKATTVTAVRGLVERLTGRALDQVLNDPKVNQTVTELNALAKQFTDLLRRLDAIVRQALNARGRFELSYAYQRVRKGESLLDVQIHLGHPDAAKAALARTVFEDAVAGRFDNVLVDAHIDVLRVASAAFSDALKRTSTVNVHVFGWDYKQVGSLLTNLSSSVEVARTGFVTVYSITVEGDDTFESSRRKIALNYLLSVTGVVQGAFQADADLRRQAVDALATLESVQSQFQYEIKDPVTSLDELGSYLSIGEQLAMLTPEQARHLANTLRELRHPANGAPAAFDMDLGGIQVHYTMGFEGPALARALTQDLRDHEIGWWDGDGRPIRKLAADHQQALQAVYVDRLIASQVLGKANDYGVAALYRAGVHTKFLVNPQLALANSGLRRIMLTRGAEVVRIDPSEQHFELARQHFAINERLARLLDDFRKAVGQNTMSIGELEDFLEGVVKRLKRIGSTRDKNLPFMLLDELVRRTTPAGERGRRALLEIKLLDRTGKATNYLPIVG